MDSPSLRAPFFMKVGCTTALYIAVVSLTQTRFMADTIDYVRMAQEFTLSQWEFGHLLWIPAGRLAGDIILQLGLAGGDQSRAITQGLIAMNLASGLLATFTLTAILHHRRTSLGVTLAVVAAMLGTQVFANYMQSGASYIPALSCVMTALWLALRPTQRPMLTSVASGIALSLGLGFWAPFVIIVPTMLLIPILLRHDDPNRWRSLATLTLTLTVVTGLIFLGAAALTGVRDPAGLADWIRESSHGVKSKGVSRALFGMARSTIFMGEDGVLFKRLLCKDPYNPVSLADLVGLSLWKFLWFYAAAGVLVWGLWRDREQRRPLIVLLLAGACVFGFGVMWQGGDMERYLPLFPFALLALASFWMSSTPRWQRGVLGGFVAVAVLVNGWTYSRPQVAHYQESLKSRVTPLVGRLPGHSLILVVRDNLKLLPRDFPLEPDLTRLPIVEVAIPGLVDTDRWIDEAVTRITASWQKAGEVWIARRLLRDQPAPQSLWVEGDDPRLKWVDVRAFFTSLPTDDAVGGDDGFVRLRPADLSPDQESAPLAN